MNYYTISIEGKNPRRFLLKIINNHINCSNIIYERKRIVLNVSYEDYEKVKELNTIYELNIIKTRGKKRLEQLFKQYLIFLIFMVFGLILIFILSNIIFKIEVVHEKKAIRSLVINELKKENIELYSFKKDYNKLREISLRIKENNKDKIEWIEIEPVGVTYKVRVIERVLKDKNKENKDATDIVANKNGMIIDMYTESGEIKKNKGDYVKKGEVIVSGLITRNENIVGSAKSKAEVYAEVWYKVTLHSNLKQEIKVNQKENVKKLILNIGNKEFVLFKKKTDGQLGSQSIFKGIFTKLSFKTEKLLKKEIKIYDHNSLKIILEEAAKKEIERSLGENEKILMQKTLKSNIKDGKINLEVFFKVYENIALEQKTVIPKDDKTKEVR